jgi:hypothetical protein
LNPVGNFLNGTVHSCQEFLLFSQMWIFQD